MIHFFLFDPKVFHLILTSSFVFLLINPLENLLYYSIGRHTDDKFKFEAPTKKDLIKIILITLFFALLQGILTWKFNGA